MHMYTQGCVGVGGGGDEGQATQPGSQDIVVSQRESKEIQGIPDLRKNKQNYIPGRIVKTSTENDLKFL